jgi:hypothetical protein
VPGQSISRNQNVYPQARRVLELKEGAQVVLLRNLAPARGLVNGARGVVEGFSGTTSRVPIIRFANVRAHAWLAGSDALIVSSTVKGNDDSFDDMCQ